jgi:hypothetical protein
LKFSKIGDSINYRHPLGGYYVTFAANATGGTLILESEKNGSDVYKDYPNFGTLFVAQSDDKRKGVLFATDALTVSTTTFFGLGDAQKGLHINTASEQGSVLFAEKLTGYAISADSERDLPFLGTGSDIGSAGTSRLTAMYDESRSKEANKHHRTVDAEVKVLEKELEGDGFSALK